MKIAIINGPNLNLTGKREPHWYGNTDFESFIKGLKEEFPKLELHYFQSNIEGEIIDEIQKIGRDSSFLGIVLNAGAYAHTSIAIADAVAAIPTPVIGVHISNIYRREPERHTDLLAAACIGNIGGFGLESYHLAVQYFLRKHTRESKK